MVEGHVDRQVAFEVQLGERVQVVPLKVAKRGTSAGWLARGVGGARAGICGCGCLAGGHAMDLQVANARFRVTASSKCATQADVRCWSGHGRPTLARNSRTVFPVKSRPTDEETNFC